MCSIDICKFICALLVVAIHVPTFASASDIVNFYFVNVAARIAVPFFYVSAGYFLFRKMSLVNGKIENNSANRQRAAHYIMELVRKYALWSLVYLLWQIPYWKSIGWTGISTVKDYVISFFLKGSYYHFWYFVSLIYGVIILFILLTRMNVRYVTIVAVFLYAIKYLTYGSSWMGIPLLTSFTNVYNAISGISDALCVAVPFMMVGVYACRAEAQKQRQCAGLAFWTICLAAEASILFFCVPGCSAYSYILSTLPLSFFFFRYVVYLNTKIAIDENLGRCLRKSSVLIYCAHPMFINLWSLLPRFEKLNSMLQYAVIVLSSVLFSFGIIWIRDKNRQKGKMFS